jgi:transcriptional antiterminator RfaH
MRMKSWYVVQTQTGREEKAEINLRRQDFEVYCPRIEKRRRHARRVETVRSAFFPGYLFTRLDLDVERWRSINGTFGVRCLLAFNERPAPLPQGFVDALMAREREEGITSRSLPEFRRGEAVVVDEGPLQDLIGRFERMADHKRVMLLIELMGREVRVTAPIDAVRRAS